MGAPKVAHPEHQTQLVVSQRDDGVLGEHQRLCPLVGLRDLHKHTADLDGEEGGDGKGEVKQDGQSARKKALILAITA